MDLCENESEKRLKLEIKAYSECGGVPKIKNIYLSPLFIVICGNCGKEGPRASYRNKAVRLWNKMQVGDRNG